MLAFCPQEHQPITFTKPPSCRSPQRSAFVKRHRTRTRSREATSDQWSTETGASKANVGLKMVCCTPSVARKSHGCLTTFRSINKGIKDVHCGSPSTGSLLGNVPKQMNGVTLPAKGDPEGLVVVRSTKKNQLNKGN